MLEVKQNFTNVIDAIAHGASDGMRISINVIAMLIGFIALIAMIDALLGFMGGIVANIFPALSINGFDLATLRLKDIK